MRLTNAIKEQIVENAVRKSGLYDRLTALVARRAKWADDVRIHAMGGEVEAAKVEAQLLKIKELSDKLPGSLSKHGPYQSNTNQSIWVNVAGCRDRVKFNGYFGRDYSGDEVCRISPSEAVIKAENPLAEEFHEIEREKAEIDKAISDLKSGVSAALSGVATRARLLKVWPDVEELIPSVGVASTMLPSVKVADLNKAIGLPS